MSIFPVLISQASCRYPWLEGSPHPDQPQQLRPCARRRGGAPEPERGIVRLLVADGHQADYPGGGHGYWVGQSVLCSCLA